MTKSLDALGELYHNYSIFGVRNKQLPGIYEPNQKCKAPILTAYIAYAIAKSRKSIDGNVEFAELFCADGYYAMVARHLGANYSYGIDNDRDGFLAKANVIAERLGISNIEFIREDVNNCERLPRTEIVANVGGLYHVENPKDILMQSFEMARNYLIVQSVVSMATNESDYFESPAPGWTWGCRFSRQSFDKMITSFGWNIVDSHFNELEGNNRLEDRGSVYYLIKKF